MNRLCYTERMEEVEASVPPEIVWDSWKKAHGIHSDQPFEVGVKGKTKKEAGRGFRYKIVDIKEKESFSIVWNSYFAKLVFIHRVKSVPRGSKIQMDFQITGPLAWPLRFLLQKKIKKNISHVLKEMARQLALC